MSTTLALVILTKNQSQDVEKILKEVGRGFDAVYILDDDSTDRIDLLAKSHNASFFKRALGDSFATHRNWILKKVQEDWTFFLDADERITPELLSEIKRAIEQEQFIAFAVSRHDIFAGHTLKYGEVGSVELVRLARTKDGKGKWKRAVHEVWDIPSSNIGKLRSPLLHSAHADISSFLIKLNKYASYEKHERGTRTKGRILFEIFTYPPAKFLQNYIFKQGFRDGFAGLVYAVLMSYYSLIKRIFWYEDLVA
jgi:glycosyltransferase involved in cell wall biosynthesis